MEFCMIKLTYISLMTLSIAFSGCATYFNPAPALLYNKSKFPLTVTTNKIGLKVGKSCVHNILGLISFGDASIDEARRKGRVLNITSVDIKTDSYLGIYGQYCTVVRGS
jgi:hypothetical protein